MESGVRPAIITVCVRDDDERTFEFRPTNDPSAILREVAAALESGRNMRCHVLTAEPEALASEERYLTAKGYKRAFL